ncbi:hypothetical protein MJO29_006732, partial [Puccinia striiformis f. sp. tritici]
HHHLNQNFLPNASFRLIQRALSGLHSPHSGLRCGRRNHFRLSVVWILCEQELHSELIGPATTKPTSAEYSCDGSKLSGKPIINVCCLNYAGSLGMRKPNDPLKVSGDDFKNKFGCVEAPNTD